MFSGLVGPKASITLQPFQSVVYLHPPKEYGPPDAPQTTTLHGTLTLSLPKPREITSLAVKVVAYYSLAIPKQPVETGILEEYMTTIPVPRQLEQGEHTFSWALEIQHTGVPQERCTFGRIYHHLQAMADSPSGLLKNEKLLDFVVNPADEGDTVGLNETIQGFQDAVGPYRLTLTSEHLTVGGAVHFTMNLPSVPTDFRLRHIRAFFVQTFELRSHKTGAIHTPAPQQRQLFRIDAGTLKQQSAEVASSSRVGHPRTSVRSASSVPEGEALLGFARQGEGIELSHVARMPIDDLLRATTQHGSKTIIRVSHTIMIHVHFSTSRGGPELVLRSERPVTISSCCCMLESLLLPPYSPDGIPYKPRLNRPTACVCGFTLEQLLLKTHAPILQAHEEASGCSKPLPPQLTLSTNKIFNPSPVVA